MRKEACSCEKAFGSEADDLHARASEIYCELFISEVKGDVLYCMGSKEDVNLNEKRKQKRVFVSKSMKP